jgi:hypothetical protein
MPVPAGSPHFPVFFRVTALALFAPLELTAADNRDERRAAIHTGLPRYDPAAYARVQAEKAARTVPKNTPAPLPEAKPEAAVPAATGASGEEILELPKMTVRSDGRELPIKRLPRVNPPHQPVKDLKGEPFESATGRNARLVQKHLTKLEQLFLGKKAAVGAAKLSEYLEQKAAQMNSLAAMIEMQAALGLDPKEIKKLRAEYEKLYYSGPK